MKKILSTILKKEYIILYLVLIIGTYLRLQGALTNSFAFTYDVGRDMLALRSIGYLHKIPLIGQTTGLTGIFYGPWWYYLLAPFFVLFSGNPQGIALVMALIGILTVALAYYFGNKIGGKFLGVVLAAIISVSPNMVALSSQIWNPNIIPMFLILALLVLNKIYSSEKNIKLKYYFLLGILLFLIMDLEIVFGLLLCLGIILSIIVIKFRNLGLKQICLFILGGLIIILPRIFFELRHQFLMTKSFIAFLAGGSSAGKPSGLLDVALNRLNVFLDQFGSTLAGNNSAISYFVIILIVISLILFYKKSNNAIKNYIKTSLIILAVFLVGTILFSHDIWPHYLVGLPVFYILLFSISIHLLRIKFSKSAITIFIIVVIFIVNLNPAGIYESLTKPLWEGNAAVYRNQLAVIDYVYAQAKGRNFKYVVYTPPVYDYTYQYLFLWYGPSKYRYSFSEQSDLAYFILEPDFENPSRLVNWLEQRERDGRIVKSQEVRGGIIVQTRIR